LVFENGFFSDYVKRKILENLNIFFTEEFWAKEATNIFSSITAFFLSSSRVYKNMYKKEL